MAMVCFWRLGLLPTFDAQGLYQKSAGLLMVTRSCGQAISL